MLDETVGAIALPDPPTHRRQDFRSPVSTAPYFDAHPNMMAIEKGEDRLNAPVMPGGGGRNQPEQNAYCIIMCVAVNDSFRPIPSLLR
jgi:hypothetical protein